MQLGTALQLYSTLKPNRSVKLIRLLAYSGLNAQVSVLWYRSDGKKYAAIGAVWHDGFLHALIVDKPEHALVSVPPRQC